MTRLRSRPTSARINPFLAGMLILLAIVGTVLTLEATGQTQLGLAKLWGGDKDREVLASNFVPVLRPVLTLEPGVALEPRHVWNAETQAFNTGLMSPQTVDAAKFVSDKQFAEVRGRVLARPKPAGEPLSMNDFMPPGTQPGLTGLVPAGMRLAFVEQGRVPGLASLRFRDRFDLTMTVEPDPALAKAAGESLQKRGRVRPDELMRLAESKPPQQRLLLAQYAMLLDREVTEGKKTYVAIAVHADDFLSTMDALNGEAPVNCSSRPTLAEDPPRVEQAPFDPAAPFEWVTEGIGEVEVYQGREMAVETTRRAEQRE